MFLYSIVSSYLLSLSKYMNETVKPEIIINHQHSKQLTDTQIESKTAKK